MRQFMWDNMKQEPLKLEDITTDKLIEIEKHAEEVRMRELTLASMQNVATERDSLKEQLLRIEMECQARAIRAHSLGFSKVDLGKIFNVTQNTIKRWVG